MSLRSWGRVDDDDLPTPPEISGYLRSLDEREAILEEHSADDYFHLSVPVMDRYRSTQIPSRRRATSPYRPLHIPIPPRSPLPFAEEEHHHTDERVDLRSLEYVASFDRNLMCAICHCAFVNPVRLTCDHVFCLECVTSALANQSRTTRCCPSCRFPVKELYGAVPKLIHNMLDELLVRCPNQKDGCKLEVARGDVQHHVDQYCLFTQITCPDEYCSLTIQRQLLNDDDTCRHLLVTCEECSEEMMEKDRDAHLDKQCHIAEITCPGCETTVLRARITEHTRTCNEVVTSCKATPLGCDFTGIRSDLRDHEATCVLRKLGPFLEAQNATLAGHELELKRLQNENLNLKATVCNLQPLPHPGDGSIVLDLDSTPMSPQTAPFDSTAAHLLSLHESLRDDVARTSAAIAELDAKASVMVMNEGLRIREDMAHTNAAVGSLRAQLHWLTSAKLQSQQRGLPIRGPTPTGITDPAADSTAASGVPLDLGQPARRLSDSIRHEAPRL
ncbi:hypothetical protein MMC09_000695 [Bachmanniomyces sp. S44760]|nr:hypothetical protein [Bachmanniomyces sp. S44760]